MSLVIAAVLGAASLGGLRVMQAVFAPLTLLLPAIGLPALPVMTRRLSESLSGARSLAMIISGLLTLTTTLYVLILGIGASSVVPLAFGRSFAEYKVLILPIAVQQLFAAASAGFEILLIAGRRGRALLTVQASTGVVGVVLVTFAALSGDLTTAAWGMAGSTALASCMVAWFAFRVRVLDTNPLAAA